MDKATFLQVKRNNFAFKLSAAKYHLKMIQTVFKNNRDLIVNGKIDLHPTRPLIYHYYSLVYEIYSCFDMTLHYVNKKYDLDFESKDVQWKNEKEKTKFQRALKNKSPDVYTYIQTVVDAPWFIALKATRNYLTHNGIIPLQVEYNDTKINIINPIIDDKVLHFDLNLWGEEISKFFNDIYG
ncbi:hypothetical protein A2773_01575 [Candidatus Gottesmanbacteria bacterium RIFCSPHIGHO2_01_FULL_39_10]|uniref:Uncharacterized protein n=1 Tax=Candidatus Gottesmanbacteria bacterium RIFCSPHIGHO2_01_FULL_39_10 TaxID=1798375 RepID=A0A1F5ZN95_9BACT|nr:MAG: hypothetical protein A2773_01575 [Candidatus Gottesmanbacteria bacterium RIFCSPHIGHO2_01_FULL_39_10]